jgi:flagellar protein FliO/FliZ
MVGRLLLALCFVLGLMWLIARWVRRRGGHGKSGAAMTILARQQLSRNSAIAVVKVFDQALIVGVTDGQVSRIGETDLTRVEDQLAAQQQTRPTVRLVSSKSRPTLPVGEQDALEPEPSVAVGGGALAGSALSLGTWRQAMNVIRERTVRRG